MAAFANDRSPSIPTPRPLPAETNAKNAPGTLSTQGRSRLPEGPCNFRDLSAGQKPPACGCRRFWLGSGFGSAGLEALPFQAPWCACGHHACFHDKKDAARGQDGSIESSLSSKWSSICGIETVVPQNQSAPTQPWPARSRASSQQRQTAPAWLNVGNPSIPSFHLTSSELRSQTNYNASVGLGLELAPGSYATKFLSQSPTVADADELPDTESLPPTRQPSEDHASPSGAFMQHLIDERRRGTQVDINAAVQLPVNTDLGLGDIVQSATEVATPSVSATPILTGPGRLVQEATEIMHDLGHGLTAITGAREMPPLLAVSTSTAATAVLPPATRDVATTISQDVQSALREIPNTLQRLAPLLSSLQSQLTRHPDMSIHDSIDSLAKRMDALENTSFHQIPAEQIHDQFQHLDMRLLELETRVDEYGRLIPAFELDVEERDTQSGRRRIDNDTTSFISHASAQSLDSATSSALIAAALDRVEAREKFNAIEERLDILEAIQLPSAKMPWEVEIVVLPWGRNLQGIWHDRAAFSRFGATQNDQDTLSMKDGVYMSRASLSLAESGWSESAISHWAHGDQYVLHPKACGVNSIVYHRLKSRGLVRKVTFTTHGARDLVNAVIRTFGSLLTDMCQAKDESAMEEDSEEEAAMGLTSPFIPLRKVHKSSCLRFLDDTELVTPALWSAEFLAAGIIMRASGGHKRLFVTTREGYAQGGWDGWTWSSLRQLPRVHDLNDQQSSAQAVLEADALEPCWRHHHPIDGPASAKGSFNRQNDFRARSASRVSFYDEVDASGAIDRHQSSSPRMHQPITPVSEFPLTQALSRHQLKARTLSTSLSDAALPARGVVGSLPQLVRLGSQHSKRRIRSFEQAANPLLIAALPSFVPSPAKGSIRSASARIKKRRRIVRSKSASSAELATQSPGRVDVHSLHPEADPEQVLKHLQDVIPNGGEIKPLSHFEPRTRSGHRLHSASIEEDITRVLGVAVRGKRGITPSAYATPHSGTVAIPGSAGDEYMPSESGEDDWSGVGEDQFSSNTDDHEIDDDMSEDESSGVDELEINNGEDPELEQVAYNNDDDEMASSEDELQLD